MAVQSFLIFEHKINYIGFEHIVAMSLHFSQNIFRFTQFELHQHLRLKPQDRITQGRSLLELQLFGGFEHVLFQFGNVFCK